MNKMDWSRFVTMKKFRFLKNSSKAFTVIELMVIVLTVSILAATAISSFGGYVRRSRIAEAYSLLGKIADQQVIYYEKNRAFVETGPTNIPPGQNPVQVNFGGSWSELGFSVGDAVRFGYRCYEDASPEEFICEAQGDQDGDGDPSIIQIRLDATSGQPQKGPAFFIFDELE